MPKISSTTRRAAATRRKVPKRRSPSRATTQKAKDSAPASDPPKRPPSDREVAKLYKVEQTLFTRLKREILAKDYVPKAVFEGALVALTDVFVGVLSQFETALPLALVDMPPGEMEREIARRCKLAREELAAKQTLELKKADAKAQAKRGRGRPPRGAYTGQGRKRNR